MLPLQREANVLGSLDVDLEDPIAAKLNAGRQPQQRRRVARVCVDVPSEIKFVSLLKLSLGVVDGHHAESEVKRSGGGGSAKRRRVDTESGLSAVAERGEVEGIEPDLKQRQRAASISLSQAEVGQVLLAPPLQRRAPLKSA